MSGSDLIAPYERSARLDLRVWLMFLVGLGFFATGTIVDPAANCSSDGDCAPWLVPVAKWLGVAFALMGAGQLAANPRRGSRLDPVTGDLLWWQGRTGRFANRQGRIHPTQISRIRIARNSDGDDSISLFDLQGNRQPWFDAEVIPWPQDRWIARFTAHWPHIVVEEA